MFAAYRIDEQIHKGLDRKVWLPSGGSLVIDRTEAMTVVDVNTGKFTGSGGNLEETVTKNNLEAAEEMVRQLRLRDIGGIIVVDFIDMVLESNRDLVLRRLVECLGRDRTRHQVAEVTSLGLVQMTRKRIGTGLLESFSHDCDALPRPRRRHRGRAGRADAVPRRRAAAAGAAVAAAATSSPPRRGVGPPRRKDVAAMASRTPRPTEPEGRRGPDDRRRRGRATVRSRPDVTPTHGRAGCRGRGRRPRSRRVDDPPSREDSETAETPEDETPRPSVAEAEPRPEPDAPDDREPRRRPPRRSRRSVVTRTRRRAASRPAGPPAAVRRQPPRAPAGRRPGRRRRPAPTSTPPRLAAPALHVPVKRRGARKR